MPVLGSCQQRDNRRGKRHHLLWCASTCHTVGFQVASGYQIVSRLRVGSQVGSWVIAFAREFIGNVSHRRQRPPRIRVVRKRCATSLSLVVIASPFTLSRLTSVDHLLTRLTIPTITPTSSPVVAVVVVVIVVALRSSSLLRMLRF